jgi:hypothetical protein
MDVFHVEVVGRDGVGYGVLGEDLGLLDSVSVQAVQSLDPTATRKYSRCHEFWI